MQRCEDGTSRCEGKVWRDGVGHREIKPLYVKEIVVEEECEDCLFCLPVNNKAWAVCTFPQTRQLLTLQITVT